MFLRARRTGPLVFERQAPRLHPSGSFQRVKPLDFRFKFGLFTDLENPPSRVSAKPRRKSRRDQEHATERTRISAQSVFRAVRDVLCGTLVSAVASLTSVIKAQRNGQNLIHTGDRAGAQVLATNFQQHYPCKDTPCLREHACAGCGSAGKAYNDCSCLARAV